MVAESAGVPLDDRDTYSAPPVVLKLSDAEARAFDRWLWLEQRRILGFWQFLEQQQDAAVFFLQCLGAETPDEKTVRCVQDTLTSIQQAKQLIDERLTQLDGDPSSEIEPFLRRLYGQEDFRLKVTAL